MSNFLGESKMWGDRRTHEANARQEVRAMLHLLLVGLFASVASDAGAQRPLASPTAGGGELASLAYETPSGPQTVLQLDRRGRVLVETRTQPACARYTRDQLAEVCPRLYDGTLARLSQRRLDDEVRRAKADTGFAAIPGADVCRLTLPTRSGTATLELEGPAVLANRTGSRSPTIAGFEAIRGDLERLRHITLIGGYDATAALCEEAAQQAGCPVSLADLVFADSLGLGLTAHFRADRGRTLVIVEQRQGTVTVAAYELAQR